MLIITIPGEEMYDEDKNEFFKASKDYTIKLEHSLVSIAKWETKWCKSFLETTEKTKEESIDYIRCMTITQNVPDDAYYRIPLSVHEQIISYINQPKTAAIFTEIEDNSSNSSEFVTSDLVYYWMVAFNIPFECQKWPFIRLMTLIKICSIKNSPDKKMTTSEIYASNRELNAKRRAQFHTTG